MGRFTPNHRKDANQRDIVAALEKIGCRVYEIERPVDLLVEFRRTWLCLEVKNAAGGNKETRSQRAFFEVTRAPAGIVRDAVGAVDFVTEAVKRL